MEEFIKIIEHRYDDESADVNGQEMLLSEAEIDMYWTSLGVSDEEVIELYHNHAVCEQ